MIIAKVCLAIVAVVATTVYVWGSSLSPEHETRLSREFSVPAGTLYARISDFGAYPRWRTGVAKVLVEPSGERFIEWSGHGEIPYRVRIKDAPRRLVTEIDDPSLPFSGTWTFELQPTSRGATLSITERGRVANPFFRFMSKYVFSHEATIKTYLSDLARASGETQEPL